jgi:hypothetical protein
VKRILAAVSVPCFVLAILLGYSVWQSRRGEAAELSQMQTLIRLGGAIGLFAIGILGVRARHRPS